MWGPCERRSPIETGFMPRRFAELSCGSLSRKCRRETQFSGEDNDFGLEQSEFEELVGQPCGV